MTSQLEPASLIQRNPSVLFNDFDDGLMMMDIDTGLYFDVDSVGGRIWSLLEQPASLESVCSVLVDEYSVEPDACMEDLRAFAQDLLDKGLVQLA